MCNSIHIDSKKIPSKGFAYKLFRTERRKRNKPKRYWPAYLGGEFVFCGNRFLKWYIPHNRSKIHGFCAFRRRVDAITRIDRCHREDKTHFVVKKIKYRVGLGEHYEGALSARIIIIKEFKLV